MNTNYEPKPDWKCQACGRQITHDPKGTAAICVKCGGTSTLVESKPDESRLLTDELKHLIESHIANWLGAIMAACGVKKLPEDYNAICEERKGMFFKMLDAKTASIKDAENKELGLLLESRVGGKLSRNRKEDK